jgi:DNA modification methylase
MKNQQESSRIDVTCEAATALPLDSLLDFQGGIKTISDENLAKLKRRIVEHGINAPVFVWRTKAKKPKHYIIDGHQRCMALRELRDEGYTVPDVPVAFIEAKSKKDAADKLPAITSQYGDFVPELVLEFAGDLSFDDFRLTTGEITLIREPEETEQDDDVPTDVPARCSEGDLWALGSHRLLCGDATSAEDVERLMEHGSPLLMVTDPPYGVNYDPAWRNRAAEKGLITYAARRVGEVANDDRADWSDAWALFRGDVVYAWSAAGGLMVTAAVALEQSGYEIRSQIIWSKPHLPISRGHYRGRHEPCWYAVRKGKSAHWIGDRKQSTVWEIALDKNVAGGHSTQKPVECMERPMRNHDSDYVYDPFVGSGTSIIAAERAGRTCLAIELNPQYCDIVIERYRLWCEANGVERKIEKI